MRDPKPLMSWLLLSMIKGFSSGRTAFFITLIPITVLAALVVPVAQATTTVRAQSKGESILTQIRVTRSEGSTEENLKADDLAELAAIDQVTALIPQDPATLYSPEDEATASWGATVLVVDPASLPKEVPADVARNLTGNQVIVPSAIGGTDLTRWVGRSMSATYSEMIDPHTGEARNITVEVVASYPSTWSAPYPDTIFASQDLVVRLLSAQYMVAEKDFLATEGFAEVVVNVSSTDAVDPVADQIRRLGLDAYPLQDRLGRLPESLEILPQVIAIVGLGTLIAATALIIGAVGSTLRRRTQEFGLLRLRGWKKADILRLVLADVGLGLVFGTTLGSLVGLWLGAMLAQVLLHEPGAIGPASIAIGAIWVVVVTLSGLTALGATLVGLRRDPFIAIMTPA